MQYRIYLAGPDVFRPDAAAHGACLKALCAAYGFEGLFPLDNVIEAEGAPAMARAIREANLELIRRCDAVIANLSPFRGFEPDSGTVFEVGYAAALGKRVVGYAEDLRPMRERLRDVQGLEGAEVDREGLLIEEFGLSHNLMFGELVRARSAEEALRLLRVSGASRGEK
jgi:nucleoside 2-deoxyribosyltransferase